MVKLIKNAKTIMGISIKFKISLSLGLFMCITSLSAQSVRNPDATAILNYLYCLPEGNNKRIISGQFERWGDAVEPLSSEENFLNIVQQKTGRWVGLAGVEYHQGTAVNYEKPNQLCIEYWNRGGLCQIYLIMSNPADTQAYNGGGECDINLVLDPEHPYNGYFFKELDRVADGLEELCNHGVVIFVNMFPEATGDWFWWGGKTQPEFIKLYRSVYDYLVNKRGLNNLLFVYEPSSYHEAAIDYYPGHRFVDIIGISLFVDYNEELNFTSIPNYHELKALGKPMGLSQWGPRRGSDQTGTIDQPPADNMKLIRGIIDYYPEIVWWMNWSYAYSISSLDESNYHDVELLNHSWVINLEDINWRK
jgi:mannan endo-1,4-beta-mannosidase